MVEQESSRRSRRSGRGGTASPAEPEVDDDPNTTRQCVAWLRENAVSLTVLIALGSGIFYLGSTLASKADVANTASKADC